MKELTSKEYDAAPHLIQWLYLQGIPGGMVGSNQLDVAIEKHPEYFPDTISFRKKWDLIPESVHEAYHKECAELRERVMKDLPPSKGLMHWMDHPEEYEERSKQYATALSASKPEHKKIHQKHYAEYGIEYREDSYLF